MKELKVNEYVRMKDGIIGKVKKIEGITNKTIELDNGYDYFIGDEKTHSKNLIDLVEEGDYVNGFLIDYINLDYKTPFLRSKRPYRKDDTLYKELKEKGKNYNQPLHFFNDDIETILTHEQYESNCYKARS